MTFLNGSLDAILCLILLVMAYGALTSTDLFRAIIMFIVYGLMMALTWSRLSSPDVAIAEAAIGAGLTGVLLLSSARSIGWSGGQKTKPIHWPLLALCVCISALVLFALSSLPQTAVHLNAEVQRHLHEAEVDQPVTAVLLNFRGIDTWFEIAVLQVALLGGWVYATEKRKDAGSPPSDDIVLSRFSRMLTPFATLTGFYFLWAGTHRPGGAFQAGSILGALGALYILCGLRLPINNRFFSYRLAATSGTLSFITVALWGLVHGGNLLQYPTGQAGTLMLVVETLSVISISLTLFSLFYLTGKGSGT